MVGPARRDELWILRNRIISVGYGDTFDIPLRFGKRYLQSRSMYVQTTLRKQDRSITRTEGVLRNELTRAWAYIGCELSAKKEIMAFIIIPSATVYVFIDGKRILRPKVKIPLHEESQLTFGQGFCRSSFFVHLPLDPFKEGAKVEVSPTYRVSQGTAASSKGENPMESLKEAISNGTKSFVQDSAEAILPCAKVISHLSSKQESPSEQQNITVLPSPCGGPVRGSHSYLTEPMLLYQGVNYFHPADLSPYPIYPFVVEARENHTNFHPLLRVDSTNGASGSSEPANRSKLSQHTTDFSTSRGLVLLNDRFHSEAKRPGMEAADRMLKILEEHFSPESNRFSHFRAVETYQIGQDFKCICAHLKEHYHQLKVSVLNLPTPVFCCGDIHGSFFDLRTILQRFAPFGHWSLLSTPILFLGDYVDRGEYSVHVVCFLFAWAVLRPELIFLLRGNHEDRDVNGDLNVYDGDCLFAECIDWFGEDTGMEIWRLANGIFFRLPVAAVVDKTIFICHGGIPRIDYADLGAPKKQNADSSNKDASVTEAKKKYQVSEHLFHAFLCNRIPAERFQFENLVPDFNDRAEEKMYRALVRELLWNDPAAADVAETDGEDSANASPKPTFDPDGFRSNLGRGDTRGSILEFNEFALKNFLERFGFNLLIRAHEKKKKGVEMVQGGRIITLFSCCNYSHEKNCAGGCLIANREVKLFTWYSHASAPAATTTTTTAATEASEDEKPKEFTFPPYNHYRNFSTPLCSFDASISSFDPPNADLKKQGLPNYAVETSMEKKGTRRAFRGFSGAPCQMALEDLFKGLNNIPNITENNSAYIRWRQEVAGTGRVGDDFYNSDSLSYSDLGASTREMIEIQEKRKEYYNLPSLHLG